MTGFLRFIFCCEHPADRFDGRAANGGIVGEWVTRLFIWSMLAIVIFSVLGIIVSVILD